MKKIISPLLIGFLGFNIANCLATQQQLTDYYSDLSGEHCIRTVLEEVTGSTADRCPGPNGYMLDVLYDDDRMSIDVITPSKKQVSLNYWEIVSSGFSSIDGQANWRLKTINGKQKPVALITPFVATKNLENGDDLTITYQVISKITDDEICIIGKVDKMQADAESLINSLINNADTKPCLSPID